MTQKGETLVEVKDLCKNFGVTIALSHVDFVVKTGEIRGLIGENGSGKSTVSSIIAGMQPASSGEMFYKGKPWKPATMLEAQKAGIGMIVQEAGTIANISVAENIFLGNYDKFKKGPIINKVAMISEARKALEKIGVTNINPALPARHYDMQERKLIEIAKCMYNDPELLIVDETTTALSQSGRDIIYRIMHEMADAGKAVMIISHDLNEMMEQCSTLTVLRDGVIIDNIEKENFDPDDIKQKMVGREIKGHYYRVDNDGYSDEVVLKADCITTMESLLCFDLELHKQEILGIGGLSDCGMHTLGRALYGLDEIVDGEVVLPKTGVKIKNAQVAFRNSMGYVSIKHFPGDGQDERDQHLVTSINNMDCDPWMNTYGAAYKAGIEAGALTAMVGHIMQPAWTRRLNPGIKDEDIMPGTLSREMMQGLLRGELGFNGLICTDATTMAGYTLAMSRRRAVPESIARGADMFLFARNLEEDYGFMLQGIKDGIITPERLDEAVTRILATKAALGLHRGAPELDVEKAKTIVGCAKHQQWAEECADKAITLVKEQPGVLPITPERYKKILFYTIEPAAGGEGNYKVAPACAKLRAMLEKEGFEIDDFVPQPYGEGFTTKYEEVVNNYDLILYVANLSTKSNQTVVRIEWKQPMGADCGHYMNDIPTVFVSLENPYHLQDFPRVKTYINCYSNNDHCLHQLIEKLTGRSTFKGHSPVDAFCGKWDAHL